MCSFGILINNVNIFFTLYIKENKLYVFAQIAAANKIGFNFCNFYYYEI